MLAVNENTVITRLSLARTKIRAAIEIRKKERVSDYMVSLQHLGG